MNVVQWINQAGEALESADVFFGHGTDNALDEAAWLVLHVLDAPLDGSFDDWKRELTRAEGQQIMSLLHRRTSEKIPLAYLTGTAYFAGLEFASGKGALVPRSPLAELITQQFRPWLEPNEGRQVLDMCTGSACIAIAVAHHMPGAHVDAADISSGALDVAAINIDRHGKEQRVKLIQSDLFQSLAPCRYDLIVTNPPYVPTASVAALPGEYHAEPELGLASGTDGLDATLAILGAAPDYLGPDGILVCEVGESEHRLQALLPGLPFLWLEFANGGAGVFLLTRTELEDASLAVAELLEERINVA
jgi:ribosomal protein L3 glutamine methyltransferase